MAQPVQAFVGGPELSPSTQAALVVIGIVLVVVFARWSRSASAPETLYATRCATLMVALITSAVGAALALGIHR